MSSRQLTKSQVRRIARKKADQASDEVKGQILGTANQTDLDTIGEIQDMLLGTHDGQQGENPTLNVIAKTTKGTSGTSNTPFKFESRVRKKTHAPSLVLASFRCVIRC